MRVNSIFSGLLIFLLVSCSISQNSRSGMSKEDLAVQETFYYKMFTDATKHALLGNYKNAVSLYYACIQNFPENAAPYYQLSSIYLKGQKIGEAKKHAISAVERDSSNVWYLMQLANIYQYEAIYDSAIYLYEAALKLKNSTELEYNLSILYSQNNEGKKSLDLLNKLDAENEGSREIMLLKHNVYHSMKDYDSAIDELELITNYFPEDPASYGLLAEYLTEIGRNDYAKKVYRDFLATDPENGLVVLSFAEYYARNNDIDSAFIYYNRAFCCSDLSFEQKIGLSINFISQPEILNVNKGRILTLLDTISRDQIDFRLYAAYADIFINDEDYPGAKPYLDSALVYEKSNFMLWEQTLVINNFIGNYEDVIEIANSCINYFPDEPNVYLLRSVSEHELGLNDDAIVGIDSMFQKIPSDQLRVQGLNLLAEIYRAEDLHFLSDSCYEEILKIEPDNLMVRNNYAYYLSLRDYELDKALELSKLTIIREPGNATYLDTYGWILYKAGELRNAKKYIEQAIRKGAYNNTEVLDHYGDIMYELGSCTDAIEAWEKIEELDINYDLGDKLTKARDICVE